MGIERTTISKRLKQLEADLGVELLRRSPRQIMTTAAGQCCYSQCVEILETLNSADLTTKLDRGSSKHSVIEIGTPADVIDNFVESSVIRFEHDNPDTEIGRQVYSRSSEADFDVLDLIIDWQPPDGFKGLVRRLVDVEQSLYASPGFLQKYGYPKFLSDVAKLPCVTVSSGNSSKIWTEELTDGSHRLDANSPLNVHGLLEAREATIAGLGACLLPRYLGDPFVDYGRLVRVLEKYKVPNRTLFTVTADRCVHKPRVVLFRLELERSFQELDRRSDTTTDVNAKCAKIE